MVVGMDLASLSELFELARRQTGHTEFVIVGSLSVLGVLDRVGVPPRMLMSIDVDCYTRGDPGRIFELNPTLGQGSVFESEHGFYLDPLSPDVLTLPDNWEHRLVRVPLENGVVLFFLDPNDAAVSKYARCDPRDREWIRAGLNAGVINAGVIESRFRQTAFLDQDEQDRARLALGEDRAISR